MKITSPSSRVNLEKVLMGGAVILSAYIMKIGMDAAYEKVIGSTAPRNPKEENVTWRRAMLWSAATGALLGAAKVALRPKIDSGVKKLLS